MTPRWDAKTDANQHAIVKAMRWRGATVHTLHREGRGCPDLLIGYRGVNVLMEVKSEDGKLTDTEAAWHEKWRGTVYVVRTADEALDILDKIHSWGTPGGRQ